MINPKMSQPLFEIKEEYIETESIIPGIPIYFSVIRIYDIRKIIAIARQYSYYKKRIRLPREVSLMREVLYKPNSNGERYRKPKIPSSLYQELNYLAEIMRQTPLPFLHPRKHHLFTDVLFHLVSEEVVEKRGCCYCSCFSSFSHTIRHKESLKECIMDMADVVYNIQSGVVLILPKKYYRENDVEEQNHFQRMTEIGLK
jgi:hypothetical protein